MPKEPATFVTTVPFSGFYNTIHDEAIDYAKSFLCANANGDPYANIEEILSSHIDFSLLFNEYAKHYVACVKEHLGLTTLVFDGVSSPEYYNFETDRIFATISRSDLAAMLKAVRGKHLNRIIEERFTSGHGFISYYPNHISDWPAIKDWDHNHVGTVLMAYCSLPVNGSWDVAEHNIVIDNFMHDSSYLEDLIYKAADAMGQAAIELASLKRGIEEISTPSPIIFSS